MKRFQNFGFQLGTGCLFVAFSALTCFANCAGQSERSGYQGIPVRNGLNRGAIEKVERSGTQTYSGLPHRLNQTDECTETSQGSGGYIGIPHTTNSENPATPDDIPDMLPIDSAGYRGIPQGSDVNRNSFEPNNDFARTASAFVGPK